MLINILLVIGQTYCDTSGRNSTYNETFTTFQGIQARRISSSGCPNHNSICTTNGKNCNPNSAQVMSHTFSVYRYPCFANATFNVTCEGGGIGILRNGVVIFGPSPGYDCSDASQSEGDTFDYCGGHSDAQGVYHYHIPPTCLLAQQNVTSTTKLHGPIIGFALDGFPIYGPYGLNKNLMYACKATNGANQSDCLDECNGHSQHEIDGYKYHYHLSGNLSDLSTNPVNPLPSSSFYPYTLSCFKGVLTSYKLFGINDSIPYTCTSNGYTSTFTPQIFSGFTSVYVAPSFTSSPTTAPTLAGNNSNRINKNDCIILIIVILILTVFQ